MEQDQKMREHARKIEKMKRERDEQVNICCVAWCLKIRNVAPRDADGKEYGR